MFGYISKKAHEAAMAEKDAGYAALHRAYINSLAHVADLEAGLNLVFDGEVFAVLNTMRDDWTISFGEISANANEEHGTDMSPKRAREIVRSLKALGLADYGAAFNEDTGDITGSGYFLTVYGSFIQHRLRKIAPPAARAKSNGNLIPGGKRYQPHPGHNCPSCGSEAPHLHPAVQIGGEVEVCTDAYHLIRTNQNRDDCIAAVKSKAEARDKGGVS